jgi:dienelactone hydrolase
MKPTLSDLEEGPLGDHIAETFSRAAARIDAAPHDFDAQRSPGFQRPPVSGLRLPTLLVAMLVVVASVAGAVTAIDRLGDSRSNEIASDQGRADQDAAPDVFEANTFPVGSVTAVQIDTSRKTKAWDAVAELPQRTLPVTVYFPAVGTPGQVIPNAPAAKDKGPFPLLVFSMGHGTTGATYEAALKVIASAGYIVVAPIFPLNTDQTPLGIAVADINEQTRDISFLLDRYIAEATGPGSPLSGMIDPDRLGAFGHSVGAITTIGVGFNNCCADKRLKAVAIWAGQHLPLDNDDASTVSPVAKDRPLLVLQGNSDVEVPYANARSFFTRASAPKYFVTLPGGDHFAPFLEGPRTSVGSVVTLSTVNFFDRYLKDDAKGIEQLRAEVATATPRVAMIQSVED